MVSTLVPLFTLLATALANPLSTSYLAARQQTQQININVQISDSQFKSFENANTLRQYIRSQGYSYAFNYQQLSQGVASIDRYFATKAAQTTTTNSNNGFFAEDNTAVQTDTDSTTLEGGPSYTNISLSATENLVQALSFSDGDAGTAGGAIQRLKDVSSTSTSGTADSSATVTANDALVQISAVATVENARQKIVVDGSEQDALTGGVCAAGSNGASARSEIITTMNIPINVSGQPTSGSTANSFCEAGVSGRSSGQPDGSGTSSSTTQAALTDGGIKAGVVCNGGSMRNAVPAVGWNMRFQGTYTASGGFRGTFTGVRTATAQISCS